VALVTIPETQITSVASRSECRLNFINDDCRAANAPARGFMTTKEVSLVVLVFSLWEGMGGIREGLVFGVRRRVGGGGDENNSKNPTGMAYFQHTAVRLGWGFSRQALPPRTSVFAERDVVRRDSSARVGVSRLGTRPTVKLFPFARESCRRVRPA
jgi:hypothetical protein